MLIETKFSPTDSVFIVIGANEKAKIIKSEIQSIDISISRNSQIIIYNCTVDRELTDTVVVGMPQKYTVARNDANIYLTEQDCLNSILKNNLVINNNCSNFVKWKMHL